MYIAGELKYIYQIWGQLFFFKINCSKKTKHTNDGFQSVVMDNMCIINICFAIFTQFHLCGVVFLLFFWATLRGNGCISLILRWECDDMLKSRTIKVFLSSCHASAEIFYFLGFTINAENNEAGHWEFLLKIVKYWCLAPLKVRFHVTSIFLQSLCTPRYCVRPKCSLNAMQM